MPNIPDLSPENIEELVKYNDIKYANQKGVKIGKGTRVIANAYIEFAEIGENCTISPFSTIGSEPQDAIKLRQIE